MKSLPQFIREQLENHTDEHVILEPMRFDERLGLFNGCTDMCDIIIKNIKHYWHGRQLGINLYPENFKNVENIFFNKLIIYMSDKINSTYNPYTAVYNEEDDKIEFVELIINVNGDDNELRRKIEHELTHAFEDYNRKQFFSKSLKEILDENYINALKKLSSNDVIENQVARFIHYLNKQEINANMGAFEAALHNKNIKTYDEGVKLVKNTSIYKHYEDLAKVLEDVIEKKYSKDVINILCDEFRKYDEYKNETNNRIIKSLENKLIKFFKKFNKLIPKLVYDKLQNIECKA